MTAVIVAFLILLATLGVPLFVILGGGGMYAAHQMDLRQTRRTEDLDQLVRISHDELLCLASDTTRFSRDGKS